MRGYDYDEESDYYERLLATHGAIDVDELDEPAAVDVVTAHIDAMERRALAESEAGNYWEAGRVALQIENWKRYLLRLQAVAS
jgi:hypothetical protein